MRRPAPKAVPGVNPTSTIGFMSSPIPQPAGGVAAPAGEHSAVRWLGSVGVLAALFALTLAVAAALWLHRHATGPSFAPWLFACGVAAAAVGVCSALLRQGVLEAALRDARLEARALADLLDGCQWRSDAAHRLTLLRPPRHGAAETGLETALRQPLWEVFGVDVAAAAALRAAVEAGRELDGLRVGHARADGTGLTFELHAVSKSDAAGCFGGYIGTARACGAGPAPAEDAVAASPPSSPAPAATPAAPGDPNFFNASVAHDLHAPVRVLVGFARILKEDYGPLLDRIGNDHLDRLLAAALRMGAMIDALLTLSRLSAQPLRRQPVDLSALAEGVIDELRRHSPGREVAMHIEPGLHADGDPTLLRIVLDNLLGNAWKYTAKRTRGAAIRFERSEHGGRSAYTVRDNGAGFEMRYTGGRLFEPFTRFHSASEFEGSGVGLASVRRIVQRHGGEIWADSVVDRGSNFHFTLAVASSSPAPATLPAPRVPA